MLNKIFPGRKKEGVSANREELIEQLSSPCAGTLIAIESVGDSTFADKILGDGVAIIPREGAIYAPADGVVENFPDTCHAICLLTHQGAEVLIHVGRDTVALNGRHFFAHVKEGDSVERGQLLISFELEELLAAGFDLATPVIVVNTDAFSINRCSEGQVNTDMTILSLEKRR